MSSGGAFRIGRRLSRGFLLVVTYHRVITGTPKGIRPPNSVFTSEFAQQIEYLVRHYHVVTGEEVRLFLGGKGSLPPNSVLITFDDGYENNFTLAFPILQRYRTSAAFFLTTGLVGQFTETLWFDKIDSILTMQPLLTVLAHLRTFGLPKTVHNGNGIKTWIKQLSQQRRETIVDAAARRSLMDNLHRTEATKLMTWDHVREMANAGMTFGSHTVSHQILSSARPEELEQELVKSRLKIEQETSRACWCFAYPNGESSDFRVSDQRALQAAGYECAFTQVPGFITSKTDHYALPRIPIPDSSDIRVFASRVSGVHHWLQRRISGDG